MSLLPICFNWGHGFLLGEVAQDERVRLVEGDPALGVVTIAMIPSPV